MIDLSGTVPRVLRTIAGPNTELAGPELAVDERDDILTLQSALGSERDLSCSARISVVMWRPYLCEDRAQA